jgi:hypothetical protein
MNAAPQASVVELTSRLAANNARVEALLDRLAARVDAVDAIDAPLMRPEAAVRVGKVPAGGTGTGPRGAHLGTRRSLQRIIALQGTDRSRSTSGAGA